MVVGKPAVISHALTDQLNTSQHVNCSQTLLIVFSMIFKIYMPSYIKMISRSQILKKNLKKKRKVLQ
uniref:Uncharacterized protein n=1 Tax=Octopus bimaculoides TaxID=37653 RepID=A0A0L8GGQ5_OCTBM